MSKTFLLFSLFAAITMGCAEPAGERAAEPIASTITLAGPAGESYPAELVIDAHDDDRASGSLAFLGESFELQFEAGAAPRLTLVDQATGASVDVASAAGGFTMTFTVGGQVETYTRQDELAALDLARREQHMKLLLGAQAFDHVAAVIRDGNHVYFPWLIPVIIGAVIVDACAGTELTCNGATDVQCPDGSTVRDQCGCGESTCNKCWPSTCADECTPYDPCPTPQPHTTETTTVPR